MKEQMQEKISNLQQKLQQEYFAGDGFLKTKSLKKQNLYLSLSGVS